MPEDSFVAAVLFISCVTLLVALGFHLAILWCLDGTDALEEVGR